MNVRVVKAFLLKKPGAGLMINVPYKLNLATRESGNRKRERPEIWIEYT